MTGFVTALAASLYWCGGALAETVISSPTTYSTNTSWTLAGSPYILNANVTVGSGATLSIQPGVVVKLNGQSRELLVTGTLSAPGTQAAPIIFTSIKDDSVAGDSGGDGPTVGAPGEWLSIRFNTGSLSSSLRWVEARFGGYGASGTDAMVRASPSASALIEDSVLSKSATSCIFVGSGSTVTVRRSSLTGCSGHGINTVNGAFVVDETSITSNGSHAVAATLQSSYSGLQSVVTNSGIVNNAQVGVYLSVAASLAASKWPRFNWNNIHGNLGGPQFSSLYTPPVGADARFNYWGPTTEWRWNSSACMGSGSFAAGYVADNARPGTLPLSVVQNDGLYAAGGNYCRKNTMQLAPATALPFPIVAGAAAVPIGQALGGVAGSPHGSPTTVNEKDPVNTGTGEFVRSETDLTLPGIGLPFALVRTYNSAEPTGGPLGPGWTHNYRAFLSFDSAGGATFRSDDGALLHFRKGAGDAFIAAPGVWSTLQQVAGGYELTRKDQVVYRFATSGRLESLTDRNGNDLTLSYDGNGRLAQITDTVGRQVTLTYTTGGNLSRVSLPEGRYVEYAYTTTSGVTRLTSVTDVRGKVWTYVYESRGLLEKVIDPNNHTLVRNVYANSGRVTDQYDALNNRGTFAWNASTQTSTYTDARGKQWKDVYLNNVLQKRIDPLGNETRYVFDSNLNVSELIDPRGNTTRMTYDGSGNRLTRQAPSPLSYTEQWQYNARNDVTSYTDGRGKTTSYGYDTAGNLTSITGPDPDGGGPQTAPVTLIGRDQAGRGLLASLTNPRGKTTALAYNPVGLLTSVTSELGHRTSFGYDSAGRVTSVVEPRGNEAGATPADYTTTYAYDNAGNLTALTDPLNHTWAWAYDNAGNLASITDANSHTLSYGYDNADRLTTVTAADPDGGGPLTAPVTTYTYDVVGNLASRRDANNHTTTYVYDDASRLTEARTPAGKVWTYGYDASGNLTGLVDANGNATPTPGDGATSYTYDGIDRLTGIGYSDATPDVAFQYDANSNRTNMTDGAGSAAYAYDALNRLTGLSRGSDSFAYGYDAAGNVTKRTYPGGSETDYTYDGDGRLASATAAGATTSYGYDAAGNLTQETLPAGNGHVETRLYDRAGHLTEVKHARSGVTLSRFVVTLDPVGNPASVVRSGALNETHSYRYDNLDRLTEVCFQASPCSAGSDPFIRWTYDAVGNRLTEARPAGTTSHTYDADDRLTQAGPTSYSYDNNGNQTQAGSTTYTYDLADRLLTTTAGAPTTSYAYDGDGSRLQAATSSDTTHYLWDINSPLPQLALERDSSGNLLRRYSYGAGRISMSTPSGSFYYHEDPLGSITNLTSAGGASQWTYGYEPYGVARTTTQDDPTAPVNPIRFTGEHLDPTSLYHLRARQYDPTTGRFLTLDRIAPDRSDPSTSRYAYVQARPTVLVDPSGLRGWCWKVCDARKALESAGVWLGDEIGDNHVDIALGVGAVFCIAASAGSCTPVVVGALGAGLLSAAEHRGIIGPKPADWKGFAFEAAPAFVFYGAGAGVSRLVTNPFYVVSRGDQRFLGAATEFLGFSSGYVAQGLIRQFRSLPSNGWNTQGVIPQFQVPSRNGGGGK